MALNLGCQKTRFLFLFILTIKGLNSCLQLQAAIILTAVDFVNHEAHEEHEE